MSQIDEHAEKQLRILKVITWLMMIVGPCVYLIIALNMNADEIQAVAGVDVMLYILLAVGLINLVVAAPIVTRSQISGFKKGLHGSRSAAQFFLSLSIIQMAFVEAVYIYGLVVFMISAKINYMLYFYPIGIIWSVVYWPKREKYNQLLERFSRP